MLYPGTHLPQDPGKIAGADGLLEAIERIARPQPHLALLQLMRQVFTLLLQHTDVTLKLFFTQAGHVAHVRVGHFPLKLQQVHQPMGVVG